MSLKIITIVNGFGYGGIERTLLRCLALFDRGAFEHYICCFSAEGPLKSRYLSWIHGVHRMLKSGLLFLDIVQMLYVCCRVKPNVVHSRFGFSSGGVVLAAWLIRVPVIVSIHSEKSTMLSSSNSACIIFLKSLYVKVHMWITLNCSTAIVGHSENNLNAYCNNWRNNDKFVLIYNGIDIIELNMKRAQARSDLGLSVRKQYILHVGSFRMEKNHILLIKIFGDIRKRSDRVELLLVGDGPLRPEIEDVVRFNGLTNVVHFLGQRDDVSAFYAAADVFLFPSYSEGLGNVVIEAQLNKLPVICSRIPALMEALAPVQHANMFDLNNTDYAVHIVESVLLKGLDSDSLETSKQFVISRFDVRSMAASLERLYLSLQNRRYVDAHVI